MADYSPELIWIADCINKAPVHTLLGKAKKSGQPEDIKDAAMEAVATANYVAVRSVSGAMRLAGHVLKGSPGLEKPGEDISAHARLMAAEAKLEVCHRKGYSYNRLAALVPVYVGPAGVQAARQQANKAGFHTLASVLASVKKPVFQPA